MASNVETDERRQERLRRRRERETDEERQARLVRNAKLSLHKANDSTSRYRLGRRREYYQNRSAALSSVSREAALENARERYRAASQSERREAKDCSLYV